ncbi:terminase large subunit domain-containing protein [uncultured Sphingomonas sp.]|uniref:terminase large subunit domain-containing protein n=1 Tax=uncultured Sphingomonas sp. TaxID=158754 RepID=UPI0035C9453F
MPAGTDLVEHLLTKPASARARSLRLLGEVESDAFDRGWTAWAHAGQRSPDEAWRVWVMMAGRGFGKTLAGANWLADIIREGRELRVALVAATIGEARSVMVEGHSGLLRVAEPWLEDWNPSRGVLRFRGGTEVTLFSGASPDKLRGPEHHLAWCDELAKWAKPGETWDNLQLGLRAGDRPRALVTTTPRPGPVLRRIMAEPGCVTTRGGTRDNPHLPPAYLGTMERLYGGTRLGLQELEGELLAEGGALWTPETLEACRASLPSRSREGLGEGPDGTAGDTGECGACPPPTPLASGRGEYVRIVIGVDPPSGDGTCGIVACALDTDGVGHVLADHSVTARSPEGWARTVADAARIHRATGVVAERNQGGKMVAAVLRAADEALRVKLVHASEGKSARADPIALLFEARKIRLHGRFPALEAELLGLVAGAPYQGPGTSPDRADAMVWALTELMLGWAGLPSVRKL